MVARVLIGKGTTARGGTDKYGIWVSRDGANVYTCSSDKLVFSTTNNDQVDHAFITEEINVGSVSAGSTATASVTDTANTGETSFFVSSNLYNTLNTSISGSTLSVATLSSFDSNTATSSETTTVNTQVIKLSSFKPLSNLALF